MNEPNRDLVLAILAILTESIPRDSVATVLASWSETRQTPLAQLLRQAPGMDDEKLRALESLATLHLKAHGNDVRQSLGALNAQALTMEICTEIGELGQQIAIDKTIAADVTIPIDHNGLASLASMGEGQKLHGERFRLIRQHARGGIGQVWLARDSELQREVAIKEIQPRFAELADQRARFLLEAEVTGNLEHPGIVPVYSLGTNAEGRPYYAMRFIRGESLAVAIKRFHQNCRETQGSSSAFSRRSSKWGIEFRQLVSRFLDVCNAIAYAHSRGVLHRDLKPANVMLGPYGETLVVDWGLAKVVGRQDFESLSTEGTSPAAQVDECATMLRQTEVGTTIGTPAYMSPEQAGGQIDQLGPASDVYSLGASFYELLTGKLAFRDERISDTIAKVLAGEFASPRAVDRSIPQALESICLRAMAKDPAARYSSVRALAQDIEHWMADEPVAAHPERPIERVGRWVRQHRNWAVAGAATLLGVALVASIAALVIEGARRSESTARKEAETNFDMAQRAVEVYLTSVSENTLLSQQDSVDIRTLRRDLLNSALGYYKEFAEQRKNDPSLRRQLANAYFRVGQLTREIGSASLAIEALRSAEAIWEPLVRANPKDHDLEGRLAECELNIGKIESARNDYKAAQRALDQSRVVLEKLAAQYPAVLTYRSNLALCFIEIGIVLSRTNQLEASLAIHEKARAIQEELIKQFPDKISYQRILAEDINAIGYAHYLRKDHRAALQDFHDVVNLCERLLKQHTQGPEPVWLLNLLALGQYNIGCLCKETGDAELGLPALERALGYREALAAQHPSVTEFQVKLGVCYHEVAQFQHNLHRDVKALELSERSVAVLEKLVQSQPDQSDYRSGLALSWNFSGILHDDARRNDKALPCFERAVQEQEIVVSKAKDSDQHRLWLCYYLDNLGEQHVDIGRLNDGLPYYERALHITRELNAARPDSREHALELIKRLLALGNIRRHWGDTSGPADFFHEARSTAERWHNSATGDHTIKTWLAAALESEARAKMDEAQPNKARPLLERAAALLAEKLDHPLSASEFAFERETRSQVLWELARILRALKSPADANRVDAERRGLWPATSAQVLVDLAFKETGRALLIGSGRTPISDRAKAVRELDLDQAADHLRLAIERGFKDVDRLKAHPDASFLLSRPDLKTAVARLESAPQPKSGQVVESADKR